MQAHRHDKNLPEGEEWSWRVRTIELNIQRALTAHPLCFGVETYVNKLMEQVIPDVRKFLEREQKDVPDSLKAVEWEAFVQKLKSLLSRLDAFIKQLLEKIRDNERGTVSYTHLRAHETKANLVCRLLLEKKK